MAASSEAFAEMGVAGGKAEEGEPRGDEDDVEHGGSVSVRRADDGTGRARPAIWPGTTLGFERAASTIS